MIPFLRDIPLPPMSAVSTSARYLVDTLTHKINRGAGSTSGPPFLSKSALGQSQNWHPTFRFLFIRFSPFIRTTYPLFTKSGQVEAV